MIRELHYLLYVEAFFYDLDTVSFFYLCVYIFPEEKPLCNFFKNL